MMNPFDIPGDDQTIQEALTQVNLPTLLMVLVQFCEDDRWLADRYKPEPIQVPAGGLFPDDTGNYTAEVAEEIREAGFHLIRNLRENGGTLPPAPTQAAMQEMMSFSTAEPMEPEFARMLLEETNFVDRDQDWLTPINENNKTNLDDFKVIVVGAGMSGICTGIKLEKAGIDYTILEKNDAVGGTWYENTYPDCGVDTPNHFYSFSFERNPEWSGYFSKRDELHAYFEKCTDQFGIRDHIQLKTEVSAMSYNSDTKLWQVNINKNGVEETLTANIVISAVGQLNRPAVPEIEGLDSFKGASFHSARWDHDVPLEGKRVAVIGTGCSAVQLVPKTADKASHLTVFQRSPHWISPNKDYYRSVEDGLRWALKHVPFYAEFHRARMIFGFMDTSWPAVSADADFPHKDRAMNEANDMLRESLVGYISAQLGERQDLTDVCTPDYPVFGKRLIIDNNWYQHMAREDVTLTDSSIVKFFEDGIETADGTLHEFDVIIFATGFNTNRFLWPMDVKGTSGETLEDRWGDYPQAYKGMLVPDYPNLFCLYGPNTNIVHGGSIIYNTECQVHYVMQCIALMLSQRVKTLEIPESETTRYNEEVQEISKNLAWGHPGVESWYKNSDGMVVNNSPFSNLEFWLRTHDVEPNRYETES
ncbi:MAG: 4-hydroxyacetophenone monooxygenase [Candidatus Azotimanducaceae bacterium]|jgi:4-hydroxyacetophenone monooxygenase